MRTIKLYTPDEFVSEFNLSIDQMKELYDELFQEGWFKHPVAHFMVNVRVDDALKSIEKFAEWVGYRVKDYSFEPGRLETFKVALDDDLAEAWEEWCETGKIPYYYSEEVDEEDRLEWLTPIEHFERKILEAIQKRAKRLGEDVPESLPTDKNGAPDYRKAIEMADAPLTGHIDFDTTLLEEYAKAISKGFCPKEAIRKAVRELVVSTLVNVVGDVFSFEGFFHSANEIIAVEEHGNEKDAYLLL